ncbi:MAG: hypothetical protein L6Q54_15355 [Leptospiraceae bacterium]|nr:hypothetical protein [Leptospiraceae bacterium]MCK6382611.1 hypothetical protein [Leptospiraceae bacterium]
MLSYTAGDRPNIEFPDSESYINVIIHDNDIDIDNRIVCESDLYEYMNEEQIIRQNRDLELLEITNNLSQRISNLISGGDIPVDNDENGWQVYLQDFYEMLCSDQIDGLDQRLNFMIGILSEKINTVIAGVGTGITIDTSNPQIPVISQNRPHWNNIQGIPNEIIDIELAIANKVDITDSRLTDSRNPLPHNHNDSYYTKTEINTSLASKVDFFDSRLTDSRNPLPHNHDSQYYTKTEIGFYSDFITEFENGLL